MPEFVAGADIASLLMEHVPAPVAVFDSGQSYVACSRRWREIHGLVGQSVAGKPVSAFHPQAGEAWREVHRRALAGEVVPGTGDPLGGPGGAGAWTAWEARPWHRQDGAIGGVMVMATEAADNGEDRRRAEMSRAYLGSVLETVPDAMIAIDDRGTILSFNAVAERLFGYRADEVTGANVTMLMEPEVAARHDGFLARYRETGERRVIGSTRRLIGRRKDGSLFPHAIFVGEARIGERCVYIGFLRDLSASEEAEERLRAMQAELVHMSRVSALGTMAAALAHDLNQPLAAIANYTQTAAALLAEREGGEGSLLHEALEEAGREALRAGAIVHRMREFVARSETERSIAHPQDLVSLARELGAAGGPARDIGFEVEVPPDLPEVLVDKAQLQQVMFNLIRNALDAMAEGGKIVIDARHEEPMIRFRVADNGPGIARGMEEAVFEPFISSKAGSMGLGLAICRSIIESHGGRIWHQPAPGGGAAFVFTLPIAEARHD